MEKAKLPIEKAYEPDEEAHQPVGENMTPRLERQPSKRLISFAEEPNEKTSSQKSGNYKEMLSQPAPGLSHRQKLLWLQKRRTAGLWVQCDDCDRWRYLSNVLDRHELPKKWYCRMNPDTTNANCAIPEAPIRVREEEDLIHSEYSAGSVVWARLAGWPWWPAMVDDCPDTEQFYWLDGFSDIPTHYNVVFFDSVDATRAWIAPDNLKPYTAYKKSFKPFLKDKKYKSRLQAAMLQADDAVNLLLMDRLQKFSFLTRYKGTLKSPMKINKKVLKRHQKYLKRRFNVEFEDSESDECYDVPGDRSPVKNNNVIVLGTPKKAKTRASRYEARNNKKLNDEAPNKSVQQDTVFTNPQQTETESDPNTFTDVDFKRPNSLAVQVGSTLDSAVNESFDNDTSKTFVPEKDSEQSTECSQDVSLEKSVPDIRVSIASPSSDDFDF